MPKSSLRWPTVRRAIERGLVTADHTLTLGERTYHYFKPERIPDLRQVLGVPEVGDHNIKDLFIEFVSEMDMSASYKPVLLLAILDAVDDKGRAKVKDALQNFRQFYEARRTAGAVVEAARMRMARVDTLDDGEVQQIMLSMPFRKFEQRRYLKYDRDLAYVRFDSALWRQLNAHDHTLIRSKCEDGITRYYERLVQS